MLRYLIVLAAMISLLFILYTADFVSKEVREVGLLFGVPVTLVWASHNLEYTKILAGFVIFIFLGLGIYQNHYGTPEGVFKWLGLAVVTAIGVLILGKLSGGAGSPSVGSRESGSGNQAKNTLIQCTNYSCGRNFFKYIRPGQGTFCPYCQSYVST